MSTLALRTAACEALGARYPIVQTAMGYVATPELVAAISGFGGVVITKFPEYRSLRVRLPLLKLEALAERADVKFVRAAELPITNPTPSEAPKP